MYKLNSVIFTPLLKVESFILQNLTKIYRITKYFKENYWHEIESK